MKYLPRHLIRYSQFCFLFLLNNPPLNALPPPLCLQNLDLPLNLRKKSPPAGQTPLQMPLTLLLPSNSPDAAPRGHAGAGCSFPHRHLWQPSLFTRVVLIDVPVLSFQAPPRALTWSRDSINDSRQEARQRGRRQPLDPGRAH